MAKRYELTKEDIKDMYAKCTDEELMNSIQTFKRSAQMVEEYYIERLKEKHETSGK